MRGLLPSRSKGMTFRIPSNESDVSIPWRNRNLYRLIRFSLYREISHLTTTQFLACLVLRWGAGHWIRPPGAGRRHLVQQKGGRTGGESGRWWSDPAGGLGSCPIGAVGVGTVGLSRGQTADIECLQGSGRNRRRHGPRSKQRLGVATVVGIGCGHDCSPGHGPTIARERQGSLFGPVHRGRPGLFALFLPTSWSRRAGLDPR